MTFRSKLVLRLLVSWDVLCSYPRDWLVLWRRWRKGLRMVRFDWQPYCVPFYPLDSPWGMLDREAALALAVAYGAATGRLIHIRPVYGPMVDIYARPWTPEGIRNSDI